MLLIVLCRRIQAYVRRQEAEINCDSKFLSISVQEHILNFFVDFQRSQTATINDSETKANRESREIAPTNCLTLAINKKGLETSRVQIQSSSSGQSMMGETNSCEKKLS